MSNVFAQTVIGAVAGGGRCSLALNGPAAWALPGGSNVATLANSVGDMRLSAGGHAGLRVRADTGDVDVSGALTVSGDFRAARTIYTSNMSVLGGLEVVNAYETHSSNVVIANAGTGPAIAVSQVEYGPLGPQPVATFTAGSNVALFVGSTGYVGIGKTSAGCALDVSGNVNVSGRLTLSNAVFENIQGTGTSPQYTATNGYILGTNNNAGATGYFYSYESTGVTAGTNGWINGSWYAPVAGKYMISVHFYFNSISGGSRMTLNYYAAGGGGIIYSQHLNNEPTAIGNDVTRNCTTVLNMAAGSYFQVQANATSVVYFYVGHTYMIVAQIC